MIKINSYFMQENELNELTEHLKKLIINRETLDTSHWGMLKDILRDALNNKTHLYEFKRIEDLLDQLIICLEKKKKLQPTRTISPQQLLEAKNRRKIHRLGKLLQPAERQITFSVPGINDLPESQLLPLDHHWQHTPSNPLGDQQQRWQRIATSSRRGYYVHLIPRTEKNETKVSAFGDPANPSMVYWRPEVPQALGVEQGRQLGHRYQAIDKNHRKSTQDSSAVFKKTADGWKLVSPTLQSTYSYNDSKNRTYGGKILQGSGEYKVIGLVDGHAIQAKDNQLTLDPQEAKAYPTADTHPYMMYWEHEPYGRLVREKIFEQHAFRHSSSLLQVHQFNDYLHPRLLDTHGNVSPRRPRSAIVADHIYIKMHRIKSKLKTESLEGDHTWHFPNTDDDGYGGVGDSSVKTKGKTTTAAENYRDKRANPFFPTPQIINTSSINSMNPDANFLWRSTMAGYGSPPPTPYYLSPVISAMTLNEDAKKCHFEGEELDISAEPNPLYQKSSFIASISSRDTTQRSTTVNAQVLTIYHPKGKSKPWQSQNNTHVEYKPTISKSNQNSLDQESKINPVDERYYSDDMVYDLLINQFEHVQNMKIMRPLPLDQEGDITSDLIQQRLTSEFDANITLYYLPLRVNGNHWIGLYVDRTPSNPLIYWINPNGGLTDFEKQNIRFLLNNTGIFNITLTDDYIKFQELPLQNDGVNCGPWIVEIFKFIRAEGRLPNLGEIDINLARAKQETILAKKLLSDKTQATRSKTILETMSALTVKKSTEFSAEFKNPSIDEPKSKIAAVKQSKITESQTTRVSQTVTSYVHNVRVTGGSPLHPRLERRAPPETAEKNRNLNP